MISLLECIIIQGYFRTACFYDELSGDVGSPLPCNKSKTSFPSAQRSESPLWIPVAPFCLSAFCSGSRVAKLHLAECLAYLLYTSMCCTSPLRRVLMQKRLRLHIQSTPAGQPGGWTPLSGAKWVCLCCFCLHASGRACVGARLTTDCSTLSLSAATWVTHVGWVAGASFAAATSRLCPKQTKFGFWKIEEASRWLLSQHSTKHSIAEWSVLPPPPQSEWFCIVILSGASEFGLGRFSTEP